MAEAKKPARPSGSTAGQVPKTIADVAHPGKSAPSVTSKPVIVSNRPLLHDPMMTAPADAAEAEPAKADGDKPATSTPKTSGGNRVITPLQASETEPATKTDEKASTDEPEEVDRPAAKTENAAVDDQPTPADDSGSSDMPLADGQNADAKIAAASEAEAAKQAEHDTAIQKLVDNKQYYLPINSIEQRKSKRFVILGLLLAVVLAVAWVDVALDAGLISLGNIKPLTHFFSN